MTRRARRPAALALAGLVATLPTLAPAPSPAAAAPAQAWNVELPGWNVTSSPTIADVDGDGRNDVLVGHQDGHVRAFRSDGSLLWAAPVVPHLATSPTAVDSSPTVADLDGDGRVEIIVGAGSTWVANQHGGVVVLNADGSTRWRWTGNRDFGNVWTEDPADDGYVEGVFSTPAVGDVDGDGRPDIVFAGWDQRIHALDRDGRDLPGFPVHADDTVWSSPALFDVDGDGRDEIFIGGDSTAGSQIDIDGGVVRALDWRDGRVVDLWPPRLVHEVVMSSPAIGDIDGDGRPELVVGTGDAWSSHTGRPASVEASRSVFAWHLDDGSVVPGWPQRVEDGFVKAAPSIGDVDRDGRPDVVVGTSAGWMHAWRGDGSRIWAVQPPTGPLPPMEMHGAPVIADLDGRPGQEVAVAGGYALHVMDGPTGAEQQTLHAFWSHGTAPALGNFGPDGWMLVASGFSTPARVTDIAAWRVPAPTSAPSWPTWRQSVDHRGVAPGTTRWDVPPGRCAPDTNPPPAPVSAPTAGYWILGADGRVHAQGVPSHGDPAGLGIRTRTAGIAPTASGRGYWVLGTDGGVFSFGDAAFHGSTGGMALNAPVVGMAPTPSGGGYWLLGADGGVFSFGDAAFHGSTGGMTLAAPVVGMAADERGDGYWLVGRDGGVFSFGVPFHGSVPGTGVCGASPAAVVRPTPTGGGYWVLGTDGGVFTFGDAPFRGAVPGLSGGAAAVDMAVAR